MRLDACADCLGCDQAICSAMSQSELGELAVIGHHKSFIRGVTIFAADYDSIACATLAAQRMPAKAK